MKVFIRSGENVKTASVSGIAVDKSLFRHWDSRRECYWSNPGASWDVGIAIPRRNDPGEICVALKGVLKNRGAKCG